MAELFEFLHPHPAHRSRQLRWVLPIGLGLFLAVLAAMGALYGLGNQDVGTEFFHAHKTISHTGQLLYRGTAVGVAVLTVVVVALGIRAFHLTHRIVRPVRTLHRALDELVAGNLGTRVELHNQDEFQEVGAALNRLVEEFEGTLTRVHDLVDQIETLSLEVAKDAHAQSAEVRLNGLARDLNETMEYFRNEERVIREEEP